MDILFVLSLFQLSVAKMASPRIEPFSIIDPENQTPTDLKPFSIIAIGNPGCGKSTTLNYLAQQVLFKSGPSVGTGFTYQMDKKTVSLTINGETAKITFCDTPGLNDGRKREAAGEAISKALKVRNFYSK